MNLVLIGFKSCGKTTTGRLLAERTGLRFVDLDQVFEELFYERYRIRCTYREPYEHYGEALFRRLEHESLAQVAAGPDGMVLATGGGAPMPPDNRPLLKKIGPIVYLKVSPEAVYERLQANGMPAYLQHDPTLAGMTAVWEQRHPVYEELATITVDVSGLTAPEVAEQVIRAMQSKGLKGV